MPQRAIELILMRQLASTLAVPLLLADADGDLVFLNEPAEELLGRRFDEIGEMPADRRREIFAFRDEAGRALEDDPPLIMAMRERRPVHRRIGLRGFDGVDHALEVTAFPLEAAEGTTVGGVVMFWEQHER